MTYEVIEDRRYPGEWRVEGIDDEGSCFVTLFSGPHARERALEYIEWVRYRPIPTQYGTSTST